MPEFSHLRHKPPTRLERPRELALVCAPLRSNVNLSRIVRAAACCGVTRLIACGTPRVDPEISRVEPQQLQIEVRRSLPPVLKKLKADRYQLIGLEQTTNSRNLHSFPFARRSALIVGNERQGLSDEILQQLDATVEIPVYGLPYSFNVATATAMALYEYCRQFPRG